MWQRLDILFWRRVSGPAVLGGNVLLLALLTIAGWPEWWLYINYERSPLTWFSSVQLLLLAATAAAVAVVMRVPREGATETRGPARWWLALALAMVFLALDERFQFHERLREGVFKPHGIGTELPGIAAGDFVLVFYAAAGLFVATKLWRCFSGDHLARAYFGAALALALLATVFDAGDWGPLTLQEARRE